MHFDVLFETGRGSTRGSRIEQKGMEQEKWVHIKRNGLGVQGKGGALDGTQAGKGRGGLEGRGAQVVTKYLHINGLPK